jgi:predicted RNase H-like nuclease
MANLKQIDSLIVGNPELRQKFRASRIKAAWFVVNEDPATQHHLLRKAWANKIIANYEADLDMEYRWLCSNATIQANPDAATDSDIDYVVATFLNQWAGA